MITSLENRTVKDLCRLHQKKYRQDSYLILDEELTFKAYEKGYLQTLVYCGEKPFDFDETLEVSAEVLAKIAQKEDLHFLGVGKKILESEDFGDKIIILDHLQDPLNIGRIMEACLLFGFDTLILSENCADIYNEKCLAHCKGGIYELKIAHKQLETFIPQLQEKGTKVYATGLRNNTRELHELSSVNSCAIILGNEGSGVRSEIMDLADEIVRIDMCNIDSLNVATAAAIVMYHFSVAH